MAEKVFRAFSFFHELNERKDVSILWIPLRAERIRVAPYHFLLLDYHLIPRQNHSLAKGYCDEFFGLQELTLFRKFMKEERQIIVEAEEYTLPILWKDENESPYYPIRCHPDWEKVISVKGNEVIDLPFEVDGYWEILK